MTEHQQEPERSMQPVETDQQVLDLDAGTWQIVYLQEEEVRISSKVWAIARAHYTPAQLKQMAARRAEIAYRWQHPERIVDALPTILDPATSPHPIPALPVETNARVCPTCLLPIRDDSYGWLRPANNGQDGTWRQGEPCPTCSPRVKALKAAKKMSTSLSDLFGGANIPGYAQDWTFETYPQSADQEAKEDTLAFANRQAMLRGLYLWGKLGRGKTSLAVSILKMFLSRGESGLYIRAPQYLRLINQAARGNESAMLDLTYSVVCLVVDDLGTEQATPAAIRQFYELIEERRGADGLYTVITSNLSVDELEERWRPDGVLPSDFHEGMRVTDRLRESWGELEIQGASLRKKAV